MSRVVLLLLFLVSTTLLAADVFRWVGEDGVVHYSDRPHEGAENITIQEAQTFSTPARSDTQRNQPATSGDDVEEEESFSYRSFEIVSPKRAEVLWNTGGELNVALRSRPRMQGTHRIVLYLDGQEAAQLTRGRTQVTLNDVFRGEHTLRAEVQDANGNSVTQTDVTFTVQQTSIQNPNNPNVSPVGAPLPRGPAG